MQALRPFVELFVSAVLFIALLGLTCYHAPGLMRDGWDKTTIISVFIAVGGYCVFLGWSAFKSIRANTNDRPSKD